MRLISICREGLVMKVLQELVKLQFERPPAAPPAVASGFPAPRAVGVGPALPLAGVGVNLAFLRPAQAPSPPPGMALVPRPPALAPAPRPAAAAPSELQQYFYIQLQAFIASGLSLEEAQQRLHQQIAVARAAPGAPAALAGAALPGAPP